MRVLAVAAASEAALAVALLLDPPLVVRLLLGTEASGAALVMGRVAGLALLGVAGCLVALRREGPAGGPRRKAPVEAAP